MKNITCHENYPVFFIIVANLIDFIIYAAGIFIFLQFHWILVVGYILYILLLYYRLFTSSCVHCYYYGKLCAFGKGKLCSLFFKKGDPEKFLTMKITWKSILPDFMVFLVPAAFGIVKLIQDFDWILFAIIIIAFGFVGFVGNAIVRGAYACKFCKQRELGCPAEQLFNKSS
ncbi:hypothetical protein ACFL2K_03240 [Candidatus Margulisiibacteriota bacterium]